MARKPSDVMISLKGAAGGTARLNLTLQLHDGLWRVERDGALSKSHPYASSTTVAKQLQRWLIGQAGAVRRGAVRTRLPLTTPAD